MARHRFALVWRGFFNLPWTVLALDRAANLLLSMNVSEHLCMTILTAKPESMTGVARTNVV